MKRLVLVLGSVLSVSAMACQVHDMQAYTTKAEALKTLLQQPGLVDTKETMKASEALIQDAKRVLGHVLQDKPQCGNYLGAVIAASDDMLKMTPSDIESGYHRDQKLPEPKPECYHAKDLLVHPATVYVLAKEAKTGWKTQALKEMSEVIEHAGSVVATGH